MQIEIHKMGIIIHTNLERSVFKCLNTEKQFFHPVEVERPNPQYAALLQEHWEVQTEN